jgi:CheY-like chemotaxis protein
MSGGKTVLIVEDDDDLRRFYRQSLSMSGYHVEDATNGFQALQRLDTLNPDVIVLDLLLPGLDGLTVLDELAANAHTRSIPVVVVTGTTNVEVLQLNVPCVLHKPVTSGRLRKAVRDCLAGGAPPAGA